MSSYIVVYYCVPDFTMYCKVECLEKCIYIKCIIINIKL